MKKKQYGLVGGMLLAVVLVAIGFFTVTHTVHAQDSNPNYSWNAIPSSCPISINDNNSQGWTYYTVQCDDTNGNVVDASNCSGIPQPPDVNTPWCGDANGCYTQACPTGGVNCKHVGIFCPSSWVVGTTYGSCVDGVQTTTVQCLTNEAGVEEGNQYCSGQLEPSGVQICSGGTSPTNPTSTSPTSPTSTSPTSTATGAISVISEDTNGTPVSASWQFLSGPTDPCSLASCSGTGQNYSSVPVGTYDISAFAPAGYTFSSLLPGPADTVTPGGTAVWTLIWQPITSSSGGPLTCSPANTVIQENAQYSAPTVSLYASGGDGNYSFINPSPCETYPSPHSSEDVINCSTNLSLYGTSDIQRTVELDDDTTSTYCSLDIVAAQTLNITPTTLPNGTTTIPYSQTLTLHGSAVGPFAWNITSGILPYGLTLGNSMGTTDIISGTPTVAGTFNFSISAANSVTSSTNNYTVTIGSISGQSACRPATFQFGGIYDSSFNSEITTTTSGAAYNILCEYNVADQNPANVGVTAPNCSLWEWLGSSDADFRCIAPGSGSVSVSCTLNDISSGDNYCSALNTLGTLSIVSSTVPISTSTIPTATTTLGIVPTTLPDGTFNTPYSENLNASGTATGPFTWAVIGGTIPPGLSLGRSTTGTDLISGTPTNTGTFTFTVDLSNTSGSDAQQQYTVTIDAQSPSAAHIVLSPVNSTFTGVSGGATPPGDSLTITNTGRSGLNWTATTNQNWCHVSQASGFTGAYISIRSNHATTIMVTVDTPSSVGVGSWPCKVSIADPNADNSPQIDTETYTVTSSQSPTLFAKLVAYPSVATSSDPVSLTATASTTDTTDTLNYNFFWNCSYGGNNLSGAQTACGTLNTPSNGSCVVTNGVGEKCNGIAPSPLSETVQTSYAATGTYTPLVIIEQASQSAAGSAGVGVDSSEPGGGCSGPDCTTGSGNTPSLSIIPTTLPPATVGVLYDAPLYATGTAQGPFTWSDGTLPPGLGLSVFNGSSTSVLGTPTQTGTWTFTVGVTNGAQSAQQTYSLDILGGGNGSGGGGPVCDLQANPGTILLGATSTLSWSCNTPPPTTSCSLTGESGTLQGSGAVIVKPSATETYTLSCTNIVTQGVGNPAGATINVSSNPNIIEVAP